MKEAVTQSEFLLGTTCVLTLMDWEAGTDTDQVFKEAFALIDSLEQALSVNIDISDISRINVAGKDGFIPEKMVLDVLHEALEIANLSDGRFDPSIGALVKLWGIGTDDAAVPDAGDLQDALATIDYKKIRITPEGKVFLEKPGMRLDLGGIAKGYAADRIKSLLKEEGILSAIINLGGNVLVLGNKKTGEPWNIGIQDPRELRGEFLGILSVGEKAIVTSGVYERFFMEDGIRYHHIIDTGTGYPVTNGIISTSIIHSESLIADGLSTALFAMGAEEGMKLANNLPDTGVIMIDEENRVYMTDNLRDSFKLTPGSGYTLVSNKD